ncbi:hypothetical protein [Paenibacillus apis]|uniref:Calcineurin-like phosphoesterase domain-containing protein n=1 Tax=Paenibacillus apis TaxID=1792174 RepID=A0A920CJ88_9BACL|nr:hypothetical protein [Paenibacillus apis]GIO42491.1 hypothetical protein J41TS4_22490 [Paenibacillus apis]
MEKHLTWTPEEDAKLKELSGTGTYAEIARVLTDQFNIEITSEAVRKRTKKLGISTKAPPLDYKTTTEILADGSHKSDKLLRMSEEQSKDVNYLLKAHGYDRDTWELVNARNNIWNVYSKQDGVQTLYSSKITVKPKTKNFTIDDIKEIVSDLMENYKPPLYEPVRYADDGKLLEVNMSDLHLNKMGYKDGEYNHEQAEKIFFFILNDILTRTENISFEKILFIWSHDFFNVDNLAKATTGGTPQDTTTRFADMYKQGKRMLIQGIDLLRRFAPVETIQVGANHDRLTSYTMSEVLEAWFRNDDRVKIDNDPLSRKYIKYGRNLIGFSHGDKEKSRLGKLVPIEARKDWGETLYSEIHAGHLHSEQAVKEENGVIVRYLSSPSGTDNWHYESGYVGSVRKVQSFIWDKERGLLDILHTPIIPRELIEVGNSGNMEGCRGV